LPYHPLLPAPLLPVLLHYPRFHNHPQAHYSLHHPHYLPDFSYKFTGSSFVASVGGNISSIFFTYSLGFSFTSTIFSKSSSLTSVSSMTFCPSSS